MTRYRELGGADEALALARAGARSIWGVAPLAPIHLGFDELIVRQRALLDAGAAHTVIIADYHAMASHGFDDAECARRAETYEAYLRCAGLTGDFLRGSQFQIEPRYVAELYACARAARLGAVRQHMPAEPRRADADGGRVADYLGVIMQCLDAVHLGAELVFGDEAQRKIYRLLRTLEPFARAAPIAAYYAPLGRDLLGRPLRDSTAATRITIHEDEASLAHKVRKMYAPPAGQPLVEGRVNALLWHLEWCVFPWRREPVRVVRRDGARFEYLAFTDLAADYERGVITPNDAKPALIAYLGERIAAYAAIPAPWVDVDRIRGPAPRPRVARLAS